ncbi:MAG: hypothetical protein E7158_01610 [Firmicutes bacterium]|nr:hypothetical protein [Bacillota bacterium]
MGLSINTIITLENKEKYVVLNETMYEGKKYFMVMGIDEKKEIIPTKVAIFKEVIEGIDTYIVKVKDSELMSKLTEVLREQI